MNTFSVALIIALYSFAYYTAKPLTTAAATVAAPFEDPLFTSNLPYLTMAGLILVGAVHDVLGAKWSMSLTHLGSAAIYIGTYIVNMNISADATKYAAITSRAGTVLQHSMLAACLFGAVTAHADSPNLKTKGAAAVKTLAITSFGYTLGVIASAQAVDKIPMMLGDTVDMVTATLGASICATVLALLITIVSSTGVKKISSPGTKKSTKQLKKGSWFSLLNPIIWLFAAAVCYGRYWFKHITTTQQGESLLLPPTWPISADHTFAIAANLLVVPCLLFILRGHVKLYLAVLLLAASAICVLPLAEKQITLDATQNAMAGAACTAIAAMLYTAPHVVIANSVPYGAQGLAVAVGSALSGTAYTYGVPSLQLLQKHAGPIIADTLKMPTLTADTSMGVITAAALVVAMLLAFMLPTKVLKRD